MTDPHQQEPRRPPRLSAVTHGALAPPCRPHAVSSPERAVRAAAGRCGRVRVGGWGDVGGVWTGCPGEGLSRAVSASTDGGRAGQASSRGRAPHWAGPWHPVGAGPLQALPQNPGRLSARWAAGHVSRATQLRGGAAPRARVQSRQGAAPAHLRRALGVSGCCSRVPTCGAGGGPAPRPDAPSARAVTPIPCVVTQASERSSPAGGRPRRTASWCRQASGPGAEVPWCPAGAGGAPGVLRLCPCEARFVRAFSPEARVPPLEDVSAVCVAARGFRSLSGPAGSGWCKSPADRPGRRGWV